MAAFPFPPPTVTGLALRDPTVIRGDASARRYWRVRISDAKNAVLCGYPVAMRKFMGAHVEAVHWLADHGFPVPTILGVDSDAGWIVFEDFGDMDGEAALLGVDGTDRLFLACSILEPLALLSRIPRQELPPWNDPLDAIRLRWELAGFELWVCSPVTPKGSASDLGAYLDRLCTDMDHHPQVVCHRDYHLNNVLFPAPGTVGVIDVQDLRIGPDTYDLATLLVDRAMPELLTERQMEEFLEAWAALATPAPGWRNRLKVMMLQRSLKVLANFFLFCFKERTAYARWIPGTALRAAALAQEIEGDQRLVQILLHLASAGGFDVRHTGSP